MIVSCNSKNFLLVMNVMNYETNVINNMLTLKCAFKRYVGNAFELVKLSMYVLRRRIST